MRMSQRRTLGVAAAVVSLSLLLGCQPAPLQETKAFQQAFTAVDGAGQPLLDDLAIAERLQGQKIAIDSAMQVAKGKPPSAGYENCNFAWKRIDPTKPANEKNGYINGLCATTAAFYSKIGDPPQTGVFRDALALIGKFAQALLALADGTSAAAASAQVQQLAKNAADLAGTVSTLTGAGAALGPAVTALSSALSPLINNVAGAASAEQERRVILEAQAKVPALIKALHDAAPAMFNPLISRISEQIEHEDHPQATEGARIEEYRTLVSDYMRLLDRLNDAWSQLVAAAKQPSNPTNLSTLAMTSGQIAADAATVRQSLTALRTGLSVK